VGGGAAPPRKVVECCGSLGYVHAMPQTLEKRVESLEKEFSELRVQVLGLKQVKKDWRSTVGLMEDDEMTREAQRLGREYREQQTLAK
jgi:hypothetical protein